MGLIRSKVDVMAEKLQFRDRREMQLFAEQVLQYRCPDKSFQSFGYHQPNIDQHRKVYTATDNTLYYFLPSVNPSEINTAIATIEHLLHAHPLLDLDGSTRVIKTVVLVGEFVPPDRAPLSDVEIAAVEQTIAAYKGPLDLGLSYIDEDLYWDIRRDRLDSEQGARTPVTEILTTIKTVPPVAPVTDRPRYLNRPLADDPQPTLLPPAMLGSGEFDRHRSSDTSSSNVIVPADVSADVAIAPALPVMEDAAFPHLINGRNRRPPSGNGTNSVVMLAAVTLLGLLGAWGVLHWFQTGLLWPGGESTPTTAIAPQNTQNTDSSSLPVPPTPPPNSTPFTIPPKATTPPPPTATPAAAPAVPANARWIQPPSASYNAVNLREGPGSEYRSIGAIRQGNYVIDAGQQVGNWRRVSYNNQSGWIYTSFIR